MSREARKLLNDLDALALQYKTSTIVTPSQIYVADQIIQKYYTSPIFSTIKSKVKALKSVSSKHFTIDHWVSVIDSIFSNNSSVRREESVIRTIDGGDIGLGGFQLISKYLITDYSINDAETIYKIVHTYTTEMIQSAIRVAVNNKVYNVQYINAILEREQALSNIKKQETERLRERANQSNSILNRQKVEHSVLDMATSQYNWEQQKQNAELERMMQEKFGK